MKYLIATGLLLFAGCDEDCHVLEPPTIHQGVYGFAVTTNDSTGRSSYAAGVDLAIERRDGTYRWTTTTDERGGFAVELPVGTFDLDSGNNYEDASVDIVEGQRVHVGLYLSTAGIWEVDPTDTCYAPPAKR